MSAVRWVVLALFLLGFHWPALWWFALGAYEFGVRRGSDVAALWFAGRVRHFDRDD